MNWNPWKENRRLRRELDCANARVEVLKIVQECTSGDLEEVGIFNRHYRAALGKIIDLETPRCSNGIRKAVTLAREALWA